MLFTSKRSSVKTALKFKVYNFFKKIIKIKYRETYSQLGEDIAICHLLEKYLKLNKGFYIDVGCNHPIQYSNTFLLYRKGWSGITIDLNKELISLHKLERKGDIQINTAIADKNESVKVYEFSEDGVNTINKDFYDEIKNHANLISDSRTIDTLTLNEIIEEHKVSKIDLLCIDVEGHDFKVLQSINLKKYRPKLIVVEMLDNFDFKNLSESEIFSYLKENNYKLVGYLIANGYFIDETLNY
ncbi:FkbM family methyltransferase [Polaribacter pectinis]|uniref:FkbM family methyltransferase n=1 Tax=Polaribacter pectinis TaxID=2738844 RepID=A0A7G9LCA8_9FLAO|nr:FkbM family methyltransferase [Polaribacter pectinis]QNM86257.1 FkbM family methyltransferase [Polaribacter pectinis]